MPLLDTSGDESCREGRTREGCRSSDEPSASDFFQGGTFQSYAQRTAAT